MYLFFSQALDLLRDVLHVRFRIAALAEELGIAAGPNEEIFIVEPAQILSCHCFMIAALWFSPQYETGAKLTVGIHVVKCQVQLVVARKLYRGIIDPIGARVVDGGRGASSECQEVGGPGELRNPAVAIARSAVAAGKCYGRLPLRPCCNRERSAHGEFPLGGDIHWR